MFLDEVIHLCLSRKLISIEGNKRQCLKVLDGNIGEFYHFEDLWLYFYLAQLLVSAKIDCHLDHLKIH